MIAKVQIILKHVTTGYIIIITWLSSIGQQMWHCLFQVANETLQEEQDVHQGQDDTQDTHDDSNSELRLKFFFIPHWLQFGA